MSRVLVVSIHPDDETFGCGGTLLKHKANQDEVYWLNITGGDETHPYGFTSEVLMKRESQIEHVNQLYNFDGFQNLSMPTQMLDTLSIMDIVNSIDKVIKEIQPDQLYLPNRSDAHSDHRIGFSALYSCTKSFRKPYIKKIMMYETLSETEFAPALHENFFNPNMYVDISQYFEKKLQIMEVYDTEIMPDPYPRSFHAMRGLNAYRGSRIGKMYAEAFVILYEEL